MREIYARYLELENADNKQSKFVNELKNKVQDLLKKVFSKQHRIIFYCNRKSSQ